MRKTVLLVTLVLLLCTVQAMATPLMTSTMKNGGFASQNEYYIDVFAVCSGNTVGGGPTQFNIDDTYLTITYNDAVLSNPIILDANATLESTYTLSLSNGTPVAGNVQLHITPPVTPDFSITETEVWLARINFTINLTAAEMGETAGIGWVNNPTYTYSDGVIVLMPLIGSDDSSLVCAPEISGTPTAMATVGLAYAFMPTASDTCSSGSLSFGIINQPSWASFDPATGELSGTPDFTDIAVYSDIEINVTDNNGKSSSLGLFDIEVVGGCVAPDISGTPPASVAMGSTYSFTPTVNNGCGDRIYSVANRPSWAVFDTATGDLSGTPTATGVYRDISITVTDELSASSILGPFDIEVTGGGSSSGSSGGGGCFISALQ